MKYLFFIVAILISGCALVQKINNQKSYQRPITVNVHVNSYIDSDRAQIFQTPRILNFRTANTENLKILEENREIVYLCSQAGTALGMQIKVDEKDCENCIDVLVFHKFEESKHQGSPRASCNSYYNSWSKSNSTYCSSYTPEFRRNDRYLVMDFYHISPKRPIYQVYSYSSGANDSVVSVARAMCTAVLRDFPKRREGAEYSIPWNENDRWDPND